MTIRRTALGFLALTLLTFGFVAPSAQGQVAVGVNVSFAPPDLPVYEQPPCPGDDYIWTPGYWDWDGDDYFWVPGTWVLAPQPEYFWTPGYWAWGGSGFVFTAGYWGPVVGFYGGVNYGFGYFGHGYEGGRWERGHFFYNRSVNNVNVTVIRNTYNTRIVERSVTRVSYNGGNGGINARASRREEAAARERHIGAVEAQQRHVQEARQDRQLRSAENHGRPPVAATDKPGEFRSNRVVAAREGGAVHGGPGNPASRNENRPESRPESRPGARTEARPENNAGQPHPAIHPRDLPGRERPAVPNTGNAKIDKKYQQQQEKMAQQQTREREKLQQRQEKEDHRVVQQKANQARQQQTEQRHQQQTQRLDQKHTQQQQRMQQRQAPKPAPAPRPAPAPKPH